MLPDLRILPCFQRQIKDICKHFPQSRAEIEKAINTLPERYMDGKVVPGFTALVQIRKIRISLKKYQVGVSGGLRLLYLVSQEKSCVVPVYLYKKGQAGGEREVLGQTKKLLKAVLQEL